MSPRHAVKNGKTYRYYLSQAYLRKQKELAGSLPQVPANKLEPVSSDLIKSKLEELLKLDNWSIEQLRNIFRSIIRKVIISYINMIYYLNLKSLEGISRLIITKPEIMNYESSDITNDECEIII